MNRKFSSYFASYLNAFAKRDSGFRFYGDRPLLRGGLLRFCRFRH